MITLLAISSTLFPYTTLFRSEKFSVFADLLARKLRHLKDNEEVGEIFDVSDVVLTHYRLEKVREEDLELSATEAGLRGIDRKSTRLNSSHVAISYAVCCLKKK